MTGILPALRILAQIALVARTPIDTTQPVVVHAVLAPDTVYVGEQATYAVGVFIDEELRFRLRSNPEFVPTEPQGMLAYDLPSPGGAAPLRRSGSRLYEIHTFSRALFPLTPGRYDIPPPHLVYSLPLSLGFFSREEPRTIVAEGLALVARALPAPPANFTGAIGDLQLDASIDSVGARVGNPMVFTVRVAGRGNVPLLPRPTVAVPWANVIPAQERVYLDSAATEVQGTKEFDWLVTPRDSGVVALPAVRYPYFNPYTERYTIAVVPSETLRVAGGVIVPPDRPRADTASPLPLRRIYRGTPAPPWFTLPAFLLVAVAAPIAPLSLTAWRRAARRRHAAVPGAMQLEALARAHAPVEVARLRRAFLEAFIERFDLPRTALENRDALAGVLMHQGVLAPASAEADGVLRLLDRRAFGEPATGAATASTAMVSGDVCARAYAVYQAAASQGRPRLPRPPAGRAIAIGLGLLALSAGAPIAGRDAADVREFRAGIAAYAVHDFSSAASHFGTAATLAPRAPDAWADAGTAAWAAGDTMDAVVGWQRAGRLEPWARDVRDRLELVRAPQDGPIAMLPPVPVGGAANLALALWLVACGALSWRLLRAGRWRGPIIGAVAATAVALALVGVARRAATMAAAANLSVAGMGAALYAAPALSAERAAPLDVGDIVRTTAQQGTWNHVEADGDREGWIERLDLTSLAR